MWNSQTKYHPRIGYTAMPSIKWRSSEKGGCLVRTNAAGFHSDFEFVKERASGKFRAILFGDSQTAGNGNANADRYSDVLMQHVPNLEIFNYGISGTGPDQQYLTYLDCADVEHDLVIIGLNIDTIRRLLTRFQVFRSESGKVVLYAKPYYTLEQGQLELHHVPVPRKILDRDSMSPEDARRVRAGVPFAGLRDVAKKLGIREFIRNLIKHRTLPEYDSPNNPAWRLLRKILETWIHGSNIPVLLFLVPEWHFVEEPCDPRNYQARFRELAQGTGCYLHDPLPDLLKYPIEERRKFRFENDVHLKREGHQALAVSLAPAIERIMAAHAAFANLPEASRTAVCELNSRGGAVS